MKRSLLTIATAAVMTVMFTNPVVISGTQLPTNKVTEKITSAFVSGHTEGAPDLQDYEKVADNGSSVLYANDQTGETALYSAKNGQVWYSNPPDREKDPIANNEHKNLLGTQLSLTYYDDSNKSQTFNSSDHCIKRDLLKHEKIEGGVRFVYTLTNHNRTQEDIPVAISVERYEKYFLNAAQTDEEQKLLEKYFVLRTNKAGDKYYERYSLPRFEVDKILAVMDRSGYNPEDLKSDNALKENNSIINKGTSNIKIASFTIPVDVCLDGDDLVVRIQAKEIQSSAGVWLNTIQLYANFGASDGDKDGYMFIPDGSGAIIQLSNGKTRAGAVELPLYGGDYAAEPFTRPPYAAGTLLPVFGLKTGGDAFLAIIEEGDTLASVNADIGGRHSLYNTVHASFTYRQMGILKLATGNQQNVFQKKPYQGTYAVRYKFLKGTAASYSGMAQVYRDYLFDGRQRVSGGKLPLFLDVIGSVDKQKSFCGIPYFTEEALTTFDEAAEMAGQLHTDSTLMRYQGWMKGGIRHPVPEQANALTKLNGKYDLQALNERLAENGGGVYPDVSFVRVMQKKGFNTAKEAARFISQEISMLYDYDPVNRRTVTQNQKLSGIAFDYIYYPAGLTKLVASFQKSFSKQYAGVSNLGLHDLGTTIISDNNNKQASNRQEAAEYAGQSIKTLSGYNLMIEKGNAVTLPCAGAVINSPDRDSGLNLVDYPVPFYQMVMHGYLPYSSTPVNLEDDTESAFLKAVEGGASLQYCVMAADNNVLKNTAYSAYYSINFDVWKSTINKAYQELDSATGDCVDAFITEHQRLAPEIYSVTYSNGKQLAVNYTDEAYDSGAVKIAPRSYTVVKEANS